MLEKKLRKILLPITAKSVGASNKARLKKFIASQDKLIQQEAASLGISFQKIDFSGGQDVATFRPRSDIALPCVMVFIGNDSCMEEKYSQFLDIAVTLNCNVIACNYPGVGNSKHKVKKYSEVVDTCVALAENANHIVGEHSSLLLYGHSFGGAVATNVAKILTDKGAQPLLINDRSFSNTTRKAHELTFEDTLSIPSNRLSKKAVEVVFKLGNWHIDVAADYQSLAAEHKLCIQVEKDGYISESASLKYKLDPKDSSVQTVIALADENIKIKVDPHQLPLADIIHTTPDERTENGLQMMQKLLNTSDYRATNDLSFNQLKRKTYQDLRLEIFNYSLKKSPSVSFEEILNRHLQRCPEVLYYRNETINADEKREDFTLLHLTLYLMSCTTEAEQREKFETVLKTFLEKGMNKDCQSLTYGSAQEYAEHLHLDINWLRLSGTEVTPSAPVNIELTDETENSLNPSISTSASSSDIKKRNTYSPYREDSKKRKTRASEDDNTESTSHPTKHKRSRK